MSIGAVTQGSTAAEALKNINEVVQMIMDELKEDRFALPPHDDVEIFDGARVAVTVWRDAWASISRRSVRSRLEKWLGLFRQTVSTGAKAGAGGHIGGRSFFV